jgi:hypothetical protein
MTFKSASTCAGSSLTIWFSFNFRFAILVIDYSSLFSNMLTARGHG